MPRLDRLGRAVMGNGMGPLSIDGVAINDNGQCAQWMEHDGARVISAGAAPASYFAPELGKEVEWQDPHGTGRALFLYDPARAISVPIVGTDGCNELAAGGPRFAAWRAGRGVYGSIERTNDGLSASGTDGRGAGGPDGTLAITPQRAGTSLELWTPGAEPKTISAIVRGLHIFGNDGECIWDDGQFGWMTAPIRIARGGAPRVAIVNGVAWLVYWTDAFGLIAHRHNDVRDGRLIEPRPRAFHHDAVGVDGKLVVAYSSGVGEHPGELVKHVDVIRDCRVIDLTVIAPVPGPVTPPPPPAPVPPPAPETTGLARRAFAHKFWQFAFHAYMEAYPPDVPFAQYPGNCLWVGSRETDPTMLARDLRRANALLRPMIVDCDKPEEFGGELNVDRTVLWYASGGTLQKLAGSIERGLTLTPQVPICGYLDIGQADAWPEERPAWITDKVWPMAQLYRGQGEDILSFELRGDALLDRINSYGNSIAIATAWYDRNKRLTLEEILECLLLYDRWIRRFEIMAHGLFSYNRPTGMVTYPSLIELAMQFFRAIPVQPNRYDGWDSDNVDRDLLNIMGQTIKLTQLTTKKKQRVIDLIHAHRASEE